MSMCNALFLLSCSIAILTKQLEGANTTLTTNAPLKQQTKATTTSSAPIPASLPVNSVNSVTVAGLVNTTSVPLSPITTTRRPLLQGLRLPCSCAEAQCGCCSGLILERFRQKACMNFTYDPDDFALTASMSMNDRVLYKNTFSGKNPDPMCIRVPRFSFIEFCVELSNIYLARRNLHMCIDAEASWEDFTLVEWSFDCIRMGANGVAVIRPEEGGGLPLPSIGGEDQVDEDYDDSARNVPLKSKKFTVETLAGNEVRIRFTNNGKFSMDSIVDEKYKKKDMA